MRYTNSFSNARRIFSKMLFTSLAAMLLCFASGTTASGQTTDGFRWLNAKADAATWTKIETAFQNELKPDERGTTGPDELDVYRYKFLEGVGIVDHSALVVIGHRPAKVFKKENEWMNFSSAFNFDLESGAKSEIENTQWMWDWKFKRLVHFQQNSAPDITYTYLTCTECEPSEMFSALRYNVATRKWELRNWEMDRMIWWTGKDGFVVDEEAIIEEPNSTVSFDCLYGVIDPDGRGIEAIANRCREATDIDNKT